MILKEVIIFIHSLSAVIGMGTAIFLQFHALFNLTYEVRPRDQVLYGIGHRIILCSLIVLFLSGLVFLLYYAAYSPETLGNEKIYGKFLMFIVLFINGFLFSNNLRKILVRQTGKRLFEGMCFRRIKALLYTAFVSSLFWFLIFILGTFRTLNNLFPLEGYVIVTLLVLIFARVCAHFFAYYELKRQDKVPKK